MKVIIAIVLILVIAGCVKQAEKTAFVENESVEQINENLIEEEKVELSQKLLSWEKEDGIRIEGVSSCTLFINDEYWMYYTGMGVGLAKSSDGLNFKDYGTVIYNEWNSDQEMVTNPSVFQLKDERFRMIYEGSKNRQEIRKLYSAVSEDGIKWVKEEGVRLEDNIVFYDAKKGSSGDVIFTSVPDIIEMENGCLRMYYTVIDESRMAESCDEGITWVKKGKIMFDTAIEVVQDPDIVQLEDGSYKLFFSTQDFKREKQWIMSASSEDGVNFKIDDGIRIEPASGKKRAVDPDVVKLSNVKYRIYYGESETWDDFNILSAVSE